MDKLFTLSANDVEAMDVEPWLEQKPEQLRPIARKWITAIKACGPDVQEVFHDGCPVACINSAPFVYVNVFKVHVNLGFFYGADLPDELNLLEGAGKRMRHIKLKPGNTLNENTIRTLIHSAYKDIKDKLLVE